AFFPKEPVPPVIRITLSSNTISVLYGFIQFLHLPSQLRTEEDGEVEMYIIVALKPDLKWQDLRNHQMLCLGAFQLYGDKKALAAQEIGRNLTGNRVYAFLKMMKCRNKIGLINLLRQEKPGIPLVGQFNDDPQVMNSSKTTKSDLHIDRLARKERLLR